MTNLQLFNFNGQEVRTLLIDDEPYFVGNDVANVLGYKRKGDALSKLDENERKTLTYKAFGDLAQSLWRGNDYSNKTLITESGVYSLIFSSELPQAKEFKRWVTSEVLPTIRKHGAYATEQTLEQMLADPQTMITTLQRLKEEQDARKLLEVEVKEEKEGRLIAEQQVKELKPKADYTDLILQNKSLVTITQIAKDYGMSGQKMNSLLHDLGVKYKQGETWLLYSKHQAKGWTQSETHMITDKNGHDKAIMRTKWTQKGRLGIYELLKANGVLPLIEKGE